MIYLKKKLKKIPRKPLDNTGKTHKKPRKNPGKTPGKPQENPGKTPEKTLEKPWANERPQKNYLKRGHIFIYIN